MAVCYAKAVAGILMPKIGADWNFNPHFQAILMWSLGLMVFLNYPLPCDESVRKAVELAFAAQAAIGKFQQCWAKLGHRLGFGIGVASLQSGQKR